MIQKLLEIENKIQGLKHDMVHLVKPHYFYSSSNLHNSQLELSQLSMQKEYLHKWESDPEMDKLRKEFIQRYMAEWKLLQTKRKQKIEKQENCIVQSAQAIKDLEAQKKRELVESRKQEIIARLDEAKRN